MLHFGVQTHEVGGKATDADHQITVFLGVCYRVGQHGIAGDVELQFGDTFTDKGMHERNKARCSRLSIKQARIKFHIDDTAGEYAVIIGTGH